MLCRLRVIVAFWVAAAATPTFAQAPALAPTSGATQEFAPTPPYLEQVARRGPVVRMSVTEVVERAYRNNLDVLIEGYNVNLAGEKVIAARGAYDPILSFTSTLASATNPLTAPSGAATIPTELVETASGLSSIRQTLPGGTSASITVNGQRVSTTNTSSLLTPSFGSTLTAAVTQPLLRGFIRTASERQVDLAALDTQVARAQYRLRVTLVMQQVLNQYWELVFAIESYEARRQSKAVALLQYENTSVRVQNGLLTPVALTAARAEIASRERDLLQAQVLIINAENALKQLLAEDPASPLWESAVIPSDKPTVEATVRPLADAQAMARARRPEVEQLRLQVAQNKVDRSFFTWETRPTVNLTGTFSAVGRSGTVLQRTSDGRLADPSNPAFGQFNAAWRQMWGREFPSWNLSLNIQMPLRNRSAQALLSQTRLIGDRLATQFAKMQQSVSADAQSAWQVINVQRQSLEAARLTSQLFEQQLEAQQARYDAGFSSDFELLRYQRDLVDARVRELRAMVDLQQGMIALQRATDTLIDDLKITLRRF